MATKADASLLRSQRITADIDGLTDGECAVRHRHAGSRAGLAPHCRRVCPIALCARARESEFTYLDADVSVVTLSAGKTLFAEGDCVRHVYNVMAGTLRLFRLLADGRRQITGFCSVGDFVGLSAGGIHCCWAEAVDFVQVCELPIERFYDLLQQFPRFERTLLEIRNKEVIAAQERMLLLGRKTPIEKIASFLLEFSEKQERLGRPATPVSLPMTRNDIADYLGLTVETVSRSFTRLKEERAIQLDEPTSVAIIDRERLMKLSAGL